MDDTVERTAFAPQDFDAPPPTLPPALQLGRYAVVRHLGAGGMGSVYVAYDEELHRRVAVKLLHETGDEARARMLREAQALARLSHPNVVQIHDIGQLGDRVFVAMEYIEGVTLRAWRDAEERSIDAIREVYLQAGHGLAAAHAAGLAHRDFKADNAMIGADGRVRVVDFGLARVDASTSPGHVPSDMSLQITRAGSLLGTPAYMSPEQFRGATADARSDQFSFCAALYEAFYGQRPFAGATIAELDAAVAAGAVRPPPPGIEVPPRLHQALLRGLARDPAARWPSLDDLLHELAVDLQTDPSGSPRLRRRLIVAWLVVFVLIQVVVFARGLATGVPSSPAHHWKEGLVVWLLFACAWVGMRGVLRTHALHRAIFHALLAGLTCMTLSRMLLHLSGAPLAALVVADLMIMAATLAVGAMFLARWLAASVLVCVVLAVVVATHADDAARIMLAVYSCFNMSLFIGWTLSSRPRKAGAGATATRAPSLALTASRRQAAADRTRTGPDTRPAAPDARRGPSHQSSRLQGKSIGSPQDATPP